MPREFTEYTFEEKQRYYANKSRQVGQSYARDWLLGADYAEAALDNGNKIHLAYKNDHIKKIESDPVRKQKQKAFLNGYYSFVRSFKKKK